METFIQHAMLSWASVTPTVAAVFMTGSRMNPAAVKKESDPYDFVLVGNPKDVQVTEMDWGEQFSSSILQIGCVENEPYPRYRIFLEDASRINITVVSEEGMEAFLKKDSLATVLYDPQEKYQTLENPNDLTLRTKKPTPKEYALWCQRFFSDITDVVIALAEEELVVAQAKLSRAREALLAINRAAVASDSSFHINLGSDGENLKAYTNEVEYDHLARSYAQTERARIWDAVFQACMLFRKAGLKLNAVEGFSYPKKLDVDMMRYLRKTWEETR